jgi:hypothetical protein
MKNAVICTALFLVLAAGRNLSAQSGNGGFAPFVSDLKAETRNNMVRLSWTDSLDAKGPVYVFRSARPFTGVIPPNVKPVELPYGTRSFIDETDGLERIYYFIAASDVQGRRYDVFVPQTNTAAVYTRSGGEADSPSEPGQRESGETGGGIWDISAGAEGEGVHIRFQQDSPANAVLYRSAQPIRQMPDLLNAFAVRSGVGSPFVDYPAPGIPWFYAVIYEDEISGGTPAIQPGRNATVLGVEIAGKAQAERGIRSLPLPEMTVYAAVPEGDYLWSTPERLPLRAGTVKALESAPGGASAQTPLKKPRVFARDMGGPAGGEESALMLIVQHIFARRDWSAAKEALLQYLALPRSAETEGRARFYLGQCWYFEGGYREALIEFLFVQSLHRAEANEWINAALTALVQ